MILYMNTQALILDTSVSLFGKKMLLLFTPTYGKLICSLHAVHTCPSSPALVEVDLTREKKGFYSINALDTDETFTEIRASEPLCKVFYTIAQIIRETIPMETKAQEVWDIVNAILPCLHLFEDCTTALFIVVFSLAIQQGADIEGLQRSKRLDNDAKKALFLLPNLSMDDLLTMKCPEQALQALLEEIGKNKNAKEGT